MKFSVCNAVLRTITIPSVFDLIAETGFDGVEIAPRTIATSLDEIGASHIKACRQAVESAGLEVVGFHTIFGRDPQYHILQPEPETRARTLKAIIRAVELCGELGGHVVVFGSPWQRNVPEGMSHAEAMDVASTIIGHDRLLETLESNEVTFCFEPLSEDQTDFVNRAAKAVELVDRIDHPRVGMMLDGYSISWEEDDLDTVIRTCGKRLCHFHADDETKRGPGQGTMDYKTIAVSLDAIDYAGWVSIEAHDNETDLVPLVGEWLAYLRRSWPE